MTSIHSIMEELANAQRAIDAEPGYKRRIDELETNLLREMDNVTSLRMGCDDRDATISKLTAALRAAEVARDDAMFRELLANDKADNALRLVCSMVSMGQDYIAAVVPVEPVTVGESATETPNGPSPNVAVETVSSVDANSADQGGSLGQSEANPTVPSTAGSGNLSESVSLSAMPNNTDATPPAKPYANQMTWQKPNDVTWGDFIDGGGQAPYWNYNRSSV